MKATMLAAWISHFWMALFPLFRSNGRCRVIGRYKYRRCHPFHRALPRAFCRSSFSFYCSSSVGSTRSEDDAIQVPPVEILDRTDNYLVVAKPASVVCHHSDWTGSRKREVPVLQRVRDQIQQRVNLIHRLDRGASGCLLMTYNDQPDTTKILSEALSNKTLTTKTYIALVRGEGILKGRDFKQDGWFTIDRPLKDTSGVERSARTEFWFVAGQDNGNGCLDRPRATLVLARPDTGRWHQIRKHLNFLSHPILGDTTHGNSRENREWRQKYGLPSERTCLHLAQLKMGPTEACPDGIDVRCPLPSDMRCLLELHLPAVLREAESLLRDEDLDIF